VSILTDFLPGVLTIFPPPGRREPGLFLLVEKARQMNTESGTYASGNEKAASRVWKIFLLLPVLSMKPNLTICNLSFRTALRVSAES
jgi:hypothetical protein